MIKVCKSFIKSTCNKDYKISNSRQYKGFTLAEVLITLGIVGIIAAMTLPTLVQKNQEKQTVVKLKKIYSVLQQVQMNIISEYGTFDNLVTSNTSTGEKDENGSAVYDFTNTEYIKNLFAKQLKVIQNCKAGDNCLGKSVYYLKGTIQGTFSDPALILADGTKLFFGWTYKCSKNSLCLDIGVTLPGAKKDYYTLGMDVFYFSVYSNKIVPEGITAGKLNLSECRRNGSGRKCTSWVILNENMDYTRCDDLEWGKKTKCK